MQVAKILSPFVLHIPYVLSGQILHNEPSLSSLLPYKGSQLHTMAFQHQKRWLPQMVRLQMARAQCVHSNVVSVVKVDQFWVATTTS